MHEDLVTSPSSSRRDGDWCGSGSTACLVAAASSGAGPGGQGSWMEGAAYQASGFSLFCFVSCLRSAPRRMTPQVMEAGGDRRPSRRCSQLVSVGSIGQGLSPRLGVPASLGHVLVVGVGDRHGTRITNHGPRQCLRVVVPALWPLLDGDAPFALCSDRGGTPPRS